MRHLLNFSTHQPDIDLFGGDWAKAGELLESYDVDGYELYPVQGGYPVENVPPELISALHLRFVVFLDAIWNKREDALLEIFGNLEAARHYYGGLDREAIVDAYVRQLGWGAGRGAAYAVLHAGQADFNGLVDWVFPWTWQETLEITADLANAVTERAGEDVPVYFENLWWPGSLRLDAPEEVEFLFSRLKTTHPGLVLDTGHVLNKNPKLSSEGEAIEYLLQTVRDLGPWRKHVRVVHLTRSLSGAYVRKCRREGVNLSGNTFMDRFLAAHLHVARIDQHDAFSDPAIQGLFDLVEPDYVVHEFGRKSMSEWRGKIGCQLNALGRNTTVDTRNSDLGTR